MKIYVTFSDLVTKTLEGTEVLGKRFVIGFKIGKFGRSKMHFAIDCLVEDSHSVEEAITKVCGCSIRNINQSIQLHLKDGKFVSNDPSERYAYFVDNKEDLKKILSLVKAKEKKLRKIEETLIKVMDDASLTLSSMLFKAGVKVIEGFEEDADSLLIQSRFLGGYDAWSGGDFDDICDSECLDTTVMSKIDDVVKEFNESFISNLGLTGVGLGWCTSEKAYTYFYFGLK